MSVCRGDNICKKRNTEKGWTSHPEMEVTLRCYGAWREYLNFFMVWHFDRYASSYISSLSLRLASADVLACH